MMKPTFAPFAAAFLALACAGTDTDPADAGTPLPCERPSYSDDCSQVPRFQCGFSGRCQGGVLKADWHEHVLCDSGQEEIFELSCETACPEGCAEGEIQDWPPTGQAFVAGHCAPALDGGVEDGGVEDGGADGGSACVFGHDHTCNDDPEVSSLEGTCQADGTCVCNSGFELNPATGKCRYAGDAGECSPPDHPEDCCEVTDFQCGVMAKCEAGQITVSWHEHVFCGPPPEQIVGYRCTTTCPNGCTEGEIMDWPESGQALCEDHCL